MRNPPNKTPRILGAGAFGALLGWLIGLEGADFTAGVLEPIVAQLKTAKAHHTPGSMHPGPIWHAWVQHQNYLPTHWGILLAHSDLLGGAGALGLLTGGFLMYQANKAGSLSTWGGPQAAGKGQHGTAHWRSVGSLRQSARHWQAPLNKHKPLQSSQARQQEAQAIAPKWGPPAKKGHRPTPCPPVGLLLGTDTLRNPTAGWILARDEHALILGSTRSGKSRRVIIPTIGIIGSTAQESLVISDPKGELYEHSADWLKIRGYRVIRLDLIDPQPGRSARYNPLTPIWDALHTGPQAPDYALAAKMARQVAHLITYGSGGSFIGTDPLWINGQISLTASVILWVAESTGDPDDCHLHQVYRVLVAKGSENEGQALDQLFQQLPLDHPARMSYATYQLAQGKTRASIITTAASGLQLFGDPDIAWVTGAQDHDWAQIGQVPTAVFLVIPHDDASRYMAAALYVNMVFRSLTDAARQHHGRLPIRVNVLLDEMGNLPPFPDFDQFVTVSAGMGIRLVLALQNLEQLKKHYERTERTIRGNLGTWLFLRTSDLQTAKELSEMIGKYTTQSESRQMPQVGWMTSTVGIGHPSQGLSLTGRELVTADELMRWPQDTVLVWQAGYPPAKLPLPDLSQWRIFSALQHRHPFHPDQPEPKLKDSASSPLLGEENWGGARDDETDEAEEVAAAAEANKGGDPMDRPQRVNPNIAADALGVFAALFAHQEIPIDADDQPEDISMTRRTGDECRTSARPRGQRDSAIIGRSGTMAHLGSDDDPVPSVQSG